ncbi:MAG: ferritin-like domain-containing protein [Polyangiaceae bacterium]
MDAAALRSLFARIVGATLAAPLGCASSSHDTTVTIETEPAASSAVASTSTDVHTRRPPMELRCEKDQYRPNLLAGVTSSAPFDALEILRAYGGEDSGDVIESFGDVCAGRDQASCDAERGRLHTNEGFLPQCLPGYCTHFMIVRRGHTLEVLSSVEELTRFVAPVDTPQDALLLAWAVGHPVSCSEGKLAGEIVPRGSGYRYTFEDETSLCPPETSRLVVDISREGNLVEVSRTKLKTGTGCIMIGRRPRNGLGERDGDCVVSDGALDPIDAWLERVAALEAASVPAFEELARELAQLAAPASLVRACSAAAREETVHAALVRAALSERGREREGAKLQSAEASAARDLEQIALDNVVEGCVRETFGALVGAYQAAHAMDPRLARLAASLAHDEASHAALSIEIDRFCALSLSESARVRVRAARDRAVRELRSEALAPVDPALVDLAGVPPPDVAVELLDALASALWAA